MSGELSKKPKAEEPVEPVRLDDIDERLHRLIWRGLGTKSPRQIAEETGLDASDILRIKNEMLDSVDVLTVQQRRQKVLVNLEIMSNDAMDRAATADDEFKAGLFNSAIAAMKEVGRQLAQLQAETNQEVDRLNDMRVRELMALVREASLLSIKEWSVRYGLDEDEMMLDFSENLRKAAERRELD